MNTDVAAIITATASTSKRKSGLRSLNISRGRIDSRNMVFISPESNRLNLKSQLHRGDIVVVRTGRAGVAVLVPEEFEGANCIDLLVVRMSETLSSEYLLAFLSSYAAQTEVEYKSVGAIQAHYNTTTLANILLAVPPLSEQKQIVDWLNVELMALETALTDARREIDLLREYRTRLIADVVTGKLDVRGVELPEIDDAEIPEEIDEVDEDTTEDADEAETSEVDT